MLTFVVMNLEIQYLIQLQEYSSNKKKNMLRMLEHLTLYFLYFFAKRYLYAHINENQFFLQQNFIAIGTYRL